MNEYKRMCLYLKEDLNTIRNNLINELTINKEDYLEYVENFFYEEYLQNIKDDDNFWSNIIAFACVRYYNINIGIGKDLNIYIDESQPIHLYLYDNPNILQIKEETDQKLNDTWDLWIDNKDVKNHKMNNWLDTIKKVISFDSIKDFWGVFNNMPNPSFLPIPSDYYLFRKDIIPCWDDLKNREGGKMTIVLKKLRGNINYELLDEIWISTVLGCIGEMFDTNIITGVVLNIRKHQDRINIWTNTSVKDDIISLGNEWKRVLSLNNFSYYFSFIKHDNDTVNYIIT